MNTDIQNPPAELAIRCCVDLPRGGDQTGIPLDFIAKGPTIGGVAIGVGVFVMSYPERFWTAEDLAKEVMDPSESIEELREAVEALVGLPWFETKLAGGVR